jgi:1,5-anhydro-D-fructose reductase (1,5-anhydro-D-mannitol-forming)
MTTLAFGPRLATRGVDDRSLGFLVAGASNVAARWMLTAIRQQPPAPGSRDVAGAWIAAVYSHNERRARQFAQTHGIIHAGDDLQVLLRRPEIQCVYVGNHPRHHAEAVRAGLEAHKHVLCEPPLALTVDEAETLHQMAEHRGLVLAMNYTWRAASVIHQLHELLIEDAIGELLGGRIQNTAYLPPEQHTWRLQTNGGGVGWDRTLHDLDLIQFLLHTPVREVYARSTRNLLAAEVEDDIVAYAVVTGGLVMQLHDSFVLPHAPVTVEMFGANGTLTALYCASAAGQGELLLTRGEQTTPIARQIIDPYRASVARFLAAVRGSAPPLATSADDLRNLAAIAALRIALAQGQVTKVDRVLL